MHTLVIGAGGYVGARLVPRLLDRGHRVRAGFTDPTRARQLPWGDRVSAVRCDVLDADSVHAAMDSVEAVVYLVHRMGGGSDFAAEDAAGAAVTREAMDAAAVRRCVYLSGLAPTGGGRREPSLHLRSRAEVEQILGSGSTPLLTLRAGVVIGAGSTSFEVLRALCEKLPVQPVPTWMRHRVEPVAEADLLEALVGAVDGPVRTGRADVGCGEPVRYPELLRRYSRVARLPTLRVPVPPVPSDLVAAGLCPVLTQDPVTVAAMLDSLHHDMVCGDRDRAAELVPPGWRWTGIDAAIAAALRDPTPVRR